MGGLIPLLSLAVYLSAAQAAYPAEPRQLIERQVEALKLSALRLDARAAHERMERAYPLDSRIEVFVEIAHPGFVPESAEVRFGDDTVFATRYTGAEATALMDGGWHRLARFSFAEESGELRARVIGRVAGPGPGEASAETVVELAFTHDPRVSVAVGARRILLRVGEEVRVVSSTERRAGQAVELSYRDPVADMPRLLDAYPPGTDEDPRLAVARFHVHAGQSLPAWQELESLLADWASPPDGELAWLLGRVLLRLGLPHAAEEAFSKLDASGTPASRALEAQLLLAEADYERGHSAQALSRLVADPAPLPQTLRLDWTDLRARALLATGDAPGAAALLASVRAREQMPHMRFNLGLAQLQAGDAGAGLGTLQALGRNGVDSGDPALDAGLRDRALLRVARHRLDAGDVESARGLLREIHADGPYANTALLMLGWSYLMGVPSAPADLPVGNGAGAAGLGRLLALLPLSRGDEPEPELTPIESALTLWRMLIAAPHADRDDPAVQEALLGIARLTEMQGDDMAAYLAYQETVEALESTIAALDDGIAAVEDGRLVRMLAGSGRSDALGRDWRVGALPDLPATYWLAAQISGHAFVDELRAFRDLDLIARRVAALEADDRGLLRGLSLARSEQATRLQAMIRAELQQRRDATDRHLVHARMGMAAVQERALRP